MGIGPLLLRIIWSFRYDLESHIESYTISIWTHFGFRVLGSMVQGLGFMVYVHVLCVGVCVEPQGDSALSKTVLQTFVP